ncbi:MAG: VOC family protein [Chitinophagaceae bacterium]
MKVKTIKKSIDINAPKQQVWNILVEDEYTRDWYSEFSPGSHVETDWKEGGKAVFSDHTNCGMVAKIIANKPLEELAFEYTGFLKDGVEDYESEGAKAMKGGKEIYILKGENGTTHLDIASDMGDEWFDSMSVAWDKALQKVKQLAEGKKTYPTQINAYLTFNGNCKEAMSFYKECLGGELTIQTVGESPIAGQCPEAIQGQVMHASLMNNNLLLMASDMMSSAKCVHGNTIALSLNCSSENEIHSFFKNLVEGGTIIEDVKLQFWGALFGVLKDKYGFTWMLHFDKSKH